MHLIGDYYFECHFIHPFTLRGYSCLQYLQVTVFQIQVLPTYVSQLNIFLLLPVLVQPGQVFHSDFASSTVFQYRLHQQFCRSHLCQGQVKYKENVILNFSHQTQSLKQPGNDSVMKKLNCFGNIKMNLGLIQYWCSYIQGLESVNFLD